ncbi:collagenase [uncultured Shewanella sp.]|uniref:collagenase n=1 Tax=uncultured Shewanella sp. TaxID=173975 RepID=UPI0026352310|nr:collagenase [uncultured Shewanella sp.]
MSNNKNLFKPLYLSLAIALSLSACGGSSDDTSADVITPDPAPVPEIDNAGDKLVLDTVKQHINTSDPISFYVDVEEQAASLVVSLFSGTENKALGDPDVYVRYESTATSGEAGEYDCVSFNQSNANETCIIDDVEPGRFHILVDANSDSPTVDASILATTSLFNQSLLCEEPVRIRAQDLTSEQMIHACDVISKTKQRFDSVLGANIAPEFGVSVPKDLNEVTNINIFSSLSNHAAWAEHLYDTGNTSGIYFETSPTDWWHDSTILTFNALEWSGGRNVIRSLSHEYVHALDGRYNKEGAYKSEMSWWSEGLAEYIGTFYQKQYQSIITANEETTYSLQQIFAGESDNYAWGKLAVAFLIETQPERVTSMLTEMRAGNWDAFDILMQDIATSHQQEFVNWYQQTLPEQFKSNDTALALGDYTQVSGRGGWVYSVDVPSGSEPLTIATQGGSGNVDLWVNQDSAAHPSLTSQFTCHSETDNSNQETCVIDSAELGKYYITIASDFVGADIVDLYLSACLGKDCSVSVPEQAPLNSINEPYLPHWPEKGELGSCSLAETYRTSYDYAKDVSITNTTDTEIKVYWLSSRNGDKSGGSYMTLAQGDSFTPDNWYIGERVMLTDKTDNCLSVAIFNNENNEFEILAEHVVGAIDEVAIPEATAEMGSCDLAAPYSRALDYAPEFIVANSSTTPYNLYWIDFNSGEPNLDNLYATLDENEIYTADFWTVGDRMMITDSDNQCIGVLDLNNTSNIFVLD